MWRATSYVINLCCDHASSTVKIRMDTFTLWLPLLVLQWATSPFCAWELTVPWNTDQAWVKLSSQPSRHLSINWVIQIPEKLSTFLRRLTAGNLRAICTSRTPFRSEPTDVKVLASSGLFSQQGNTNPVCQEVMWKKEYLLLSTCNYAVLRDSGSFIFLTK